MFGEAPTPPLPLAASSTRLFAKLIDMAVTVVVYLSFQVLLDGGVDGGEPPSLAVSLLTLAFVVVYEVGMVATRGGTIGKLLLGARVVDANGVSPPPVRAAFLRWLPNAVAIVPLIGPVAAMAMVLASLLWIFTDPARRSIFDRVGETFVARV